MKEFIALSKEKLVAQENAVIFKRGFYVSPSGKLIDLTDDFKKSIEGSVYYPDTSPNYFCYSQNLKEGIEPNISVVNETTTEAGRRFLQEGKENILILNFASAICPGGGYLDGARAQEESLCRESGLYPCIKNKPKFYNANIIKDSYLYTHGMIYSPNVPFFRNKELELLEEQFRLSVLTAPATCLRNETEETLERDSKLIASTIETRIAWIYEYAKNHAHKTLVLGAFGCGAFRNDPTHMATTFKNVLEYYKVFDNVCFAVYDTGSGSPTYNIFKQVMNDENSK